MRTHFQVRALSLMASCGVVALVLLAGMPAIPSASSTVPGAQATTTVPRTPPLTIDSLTGPDTYASYCAGCHGRTGRGDGPVAGSLRTPMPDLTTLSARNGGAFPRTQVRAAIVNTERPIVAHGTRDMPVWGPIFHALDANDRRVDVRIDNVVAFVQTMQPASSPAPAADGRQLFLTYCASCHGPNGRGDGVMSGELRRMVPDLTKFAMRNGNMFPSVRVNQIIDGTGIGSHGTRDMPVWGDAFKRTRNGTPESAAARIQALTTFLGSIQDRATN